MTCASILFGLAFVAAVLFWILFVIVVKTRIADRGLAVDEAPEFRFLWNTWPHEDMAAYRRDLSEDERRRLVNGFLLNCRSIQVALVAGGVAMLVLRG